MLAVGAGGGCLDIFSLICHFSSFSLSVGDGPIYIKILSQRAVKTKPTNQNSLISPTAQKYFNPIALRKTKIVYNFCLSECNRVNC